MKKISVIVPVYNSEKYIQRCIDSILNQTYKNIELILIDDGSKDSSGIICDENAKKDSRIKVIHEKNVGISQARNNGISVATGYYLTFVDNDDYIDSNMYEILVKCIEENDVDYAECGVNLVFMKETFCDNNYLYEKQIFDTKQGLEMFDKEVRPYVWNKIFIREKTKNILFREGYGEDRFYVLDYLTRNRKFMYISEPMYFWNRKNENSFTRSKFSEKNLTYVDFYIYMSDVCKKYDLRKVALKYEKEYYKKLFVYYGLARRYKVNNYIEHNKSLYADFHRCYKRAMEVTDSQLLKIDMCLFDRFPKQVGYINGLLIDLVRKKRNKIK